MIEQDRPGKIFVGGLTSQVDRDTLENAFGKYGRITEVLLIKDKITNISRGYGFITYENPLDAEDAVKGMDRETINGKEIHVEQAVRAFHNERGGGGPIRSSRGGSMRSRGGSLSTRPSYSSRDGPSRDGPSRDGPSRDGHSRDGPSRDPPRRMDTMRRGSPPPRRGSMGFRGRGRGGPPSRGRSDSFSRRDPSPIPRKSPLLHSSGRLNGSSSGYGQSMSRRGPSYHDSPPPRRMSSDFVDRRDDRYGGGSSSFSERPPVRSRDPYHSSPPRDTGRSYMDSRVASSRTRDNDTRNFSPERAPVRSRPAVQRDTYERRETSFSGRSGGGRDYMAPRSSGGGGDYSMSRESTRDYPVSRGYESSGRDFQTTRDPAPRDYGSKYDSHDMGGGMSGRYASRETESRPQPSRAPISRNYDSFDDGPAKRTYSQGSRGPPMRSAPRASSSDMRDSHGMAGSRRPSHTVSRGPPPPKRSRMEGPSPKRGGPPPFRR